MKTATFFRSLRFLPIMFACLAAVLTVGNYIFAQSADTVSPTVSITSPANNATVSGKVAFTATATDNIGVYSVEFFVDGVSKAVDTSSPYAYDLYTTTLADGAHALKAKAIDAAGNYIDSSITVTAQNNAPADTVSPTVNITSPSNNATVSGKVNFAATATDNVGVYSVEFFVDGVSRAVDTSSPYAYDLYTTTLADGAHALKAKAIDAAGNYIDSSITVTAQNNAPADTVSPTVNITSPSNNATVSGKVNFAATATDNVGVYKVELYVDNKLKATVTSSPYSYDWYTTTVADGTHTLKAESYDAAGNFNIAMYAVTVQNGTAADTVPPTVSITSPSNNATVSGKVNFAATATDNVGVYKVDFYLDNATKLGTATVSPYAISWDTIVASAGTHTLSVRAYDAAGNIGLNSMTVSVNNSGSQVIVTPSPCTGYGYGSWSGCKSDGTQSRSIISYIPAGCLATTAGSATPDVLVRNCTVCAYACKDWGACVSGSKSRICPATPASCIAPEDQSQIPSLQQSCTASVVACTDYTYGSWSSCVSGKQTRTITSQSPSGCSDTSGAVLGQDCDSSVPCSSYSYGSWSGCDSAGKQARKVILSVPAGCVGGVIPVLEQGCSFQNVPCVYTYSDWGNCGSNSIQTRKIISVLPEKCSKDIAPVLEQKCDYMPPRPIQENIASSTLAEIKIPCDYSYSAWGACVLKRQTRMVVSSLPRDCDSSAIPVTSRDCVESSATALPAIAVDAPIPAPAAVLSAAPKTAANLNDRTDPQWQQYYFGAPDCQDAKICAGAADPDNDGLVNNEEYRFGTNPKSPDTDRDGMVDGNEIQNGRNPLVADSKKVSDAVIYESPKDKGQELDQIYKVDNVEMIKTSAGVKNLKITGKGLPNSYVTIYVYSDPIVLTVKTDADGNWSYTLDKPMEDGNHEVYVAVNDNAGKVIAKSTPLPFVQTAEAATVTYPKNLASPDRAPAPTRSRLWEGYLIFFMAGLGGLVLVLIAIGFAKNSRNE